MATRQQNARDFVKTWEAKEGREGTFFYDFWRLVE